ARSRTAFMSSASRPGGALPNATCSVREAAREIAALAESGPVALLFGREDKGLTNEALDRCHRVVTIPSDAAYASLNLAHAVVVMLYELALGRSENAPAFKPPRRRAGPAPVADLERLFLD